MGSNWSEQMADGRWLFGAIAHHAPVVWVWHPDMLEHRVEMQFDSGTLVRFEVAADHRRRPSDPSEWWHVLLFDTPSGDWSPTPVTARMLRDIRLGEVERIGRRMLNRRALAATDIWMGELSTRGRPDRWFAQLAAAYVDRCVIGGATYSALNGWSSPDVEGTFAGARGVPLVLTTQRMRELVSEARARGMLTPTQRGKLGGDLTERARQTLS